MEQTKIIEHGGPGGWGGLLYDRGYRSGNFRLGHFNAMYALVQMKREFPR